MADKLLRLFTQDIEAALLSMGNENAGILFIALVCENNGKEGPIIPENLVYVWEILKSHIKRTEEHIQTKKEAGRIGGLAKASNAKQRLATLASSTSHPFPSLPIPSHPIQSNKENNTNTRASRPVFVPPSLEDITQFAAREGLSGLDAEEFYCHYTANGWMAGRVKMKDWEAAARNWCRRNKAGLFSNPVDKEKQRQLEMEDRARRGVTK